MSKLTRAPTSVARRRIGRRRCFKAAIEWSGSAGCTSGVRAEIFSERFRRGSGPCAPRSLKQGAGRLIRTETDRGFVLLLCRRFTNRLYRGKFPAYWQDELVVTDDPVGEVRLTDALEDGEAPSPAPELVKLDDHSVRLELTASSDLVIKAVFLVDDVFAGAPFLVEGQGLLDNGEGVVDGEDVIDDDPGRD